MERIVETVDGRFDTRLTGTGEVTFILDHGMMSNHHQWGWLRGELLQLGRVFEYSRLGYGKSSRGKTKRFFSQQAAELGRVLDVLTIDGPFLFIGHSLGAYISLELGRRRPDETVGIVLLDPSHPEVDVELPDWYERMQEKWNRFLYVLSHIRPLTWLIPDNLGARMFKSLPEADRVPLWRQLSRTHHWRGTLDEWDTVAHNNQQILQLVPHVTPPVLVLSASDWAGGMPEKWLNKDLTKRINAAHERFADSLPDARFHLIANTNHYTIAGFSKEAAERIVQLIRTTFCD
ncbi:alpha/beta hydrolase (plasmid) [Exiguobacterium sp. N4-1P]|uniref:alpha/beta fold hydrolase n=1 Tax=Exiguobacterium sp. N4-1P TaxID=2051906 RepID=UPI000B588166|nr:alpha/beta hydrolase [Exiguobacterium sp. N4-1P]ASI35171.1 alpha/beta hydrolase [Exiguobacterium sp. N4-1P]ASI37184.1 alpha/beta hydrolase [Exiguobacterium sp. N4-1P]